MKNLLCLALLVAFSSCTIVHPGERGVRISWGKATSEVQESGTYTWLPFVWSVEKVDVQVQKSEVEVHAGSKDTQPTHLKVIVNWSIAPEQVVVVYKKLGDEDEIFKRIINPAGSEVVSACVAQFSAEEIMVKRLTLKQNIDDGLKARLSAYGINASDVSVTELTFSDQFTRAVEDKQVAEQQAKQAQYVADKAVKDAQAQVNKATGEAESQKLLQSSITPGILQKMAIEKWDGKFPQYMTGNSLPFLTVKAGGAQ